MVVGHVLANGHLFLLSGMPRNRFGGKNAKKMANKKTGDSGASSSHSITLPDHEDDTFAAIVSKRCGDGRFLVDYMDQQGTLINALARVPGSMMKVTRNIRDGSFVLYQRWGFSERDNKGSILCIYSEADVSILKKQGFLKGIVEEEEDYEEKVDLTKAADNVETTIVDIDAI